MMLTEAHVVPWMKWDVEECYSKTLVIVAALNEEEGICNTLAEINLCLRSSLCLVVDGRSTDKTVKVAKTMGVEVILHKGSGKGDAIATAIAHVNNLDVDYVAFTDADFTYPAEYLPEMIRILDEKPDAGMVCGNRFNNRARGARAPRQNAQHNLHRQPSHSSNA